MSNKIMRNEVIKKIEEVASNDNSIIVLKGIPISVVDSSIDINIDKIIENKLSYLMEIVNKRKYILYEEYLLLHNLILEQYKDVYIINNNMYIEQYPMELYVSENIKIGLLNHFKNADDEVSDDLEIGDIDGYISLYAGLREHNGYILGAYCDNLEMSTKVHFINVFELHEEMFVYKEANYEEICDLIEEADYIDLVKRVLNEEDKIRVRISNYTGDIIKLKNRLGILTYYFSRKTNIVFIQDPSVDEEVHYRPEYKELLKKYWGHDEFRNLSVYDMNKLEDGEKEVIEVSQETIISHLVDEVEKCADKEGDFRDLFVTAPTGAGKSVMFQIPAMYLAEKYELLTIVISPLIGLMNDQVQNLEMKNYHHAKTINSDISPIVKEDIISKVSQGRYHILYISPETLLSRSDVEQLIGNRTIGMIVIDEAHIVTTWGKQFRPDYWYLGDHIRKLRKKQLKDKGRSFVISTFTATAIYHGIEDMYTETINSLHMLTPITYLGYVKRDDIAIKIEKVKKKKEGRNEYELNKFEQIEQKIHVALATKKKMLIYFPTVALINRCYEYLYAKRKVSTVARYYGTLDKDQKEQNYQEYLKGEKLVMLATKAFGMGIDIDDISYVVHFAPTGNVCDYVQEIGRAARRSDINGIAFYQYNTRDFKHINTLYGLSSIKKYQLIEVMKKIVELHTNNISNENKNIFTRRRNAMLLDAENFSYIFGNPIGEGETDNINKVKTALLIIQKDFESKYGFSPINVRPIPLFSIGYFKIDKNVQIKMNKKYPNTVKEIDSKENICRVMLDEIWKKDYSNYSFPKFKFMLYSNDQELALNKLYTITPALCVDVMLNSEYDVNFKKIWGEIKAFIKKKVISNEHVSLNEISDVLVANCNVNKYKAREICEVIIASMDSYRNKFSKTTTPIVQEKTTINGKTKYRFNVAVNSYIGWVERGYKNVISNIDNGRMYLINNGGTSAKEINIILGILESMNILTFEMVGGANSQLYIYVNQIQRLINILNYSSTYENRLLDMVGERHLISVKMLTYIYEGNFTSDEIWGIIENYFLGNIPEKVKKVCKMENPNIVFDE